MYQRCLGELLLALAGRGTSSLLDGPGPLLCASRETGTMRPQAPGEVTDKESGHQREAWTDYQEQLIDR